MFTTRRRLLQNAGFGSLLSFWPFSRVFAARAPRDVYQELGIRPVINCRGAVTGIGASKPYPEFYQATNEASRHFVLLEELQEKIGARLAKLVGSEAAMVTTGAAGAITLGTCACLTGEDAEKVRRLPDLTGMKTQAIIQKVHRNGYDHAVRNTGVKLVVVDNKDQFLNAISSQTAMMYYLGGTATDAGMVTPVPLEECLQIAHKAGFPVVVDAANMIPPWNNIRRLAELGTDLICISGGKHMRGPQSAGILAGRRNLIRAAWLNSSPHSDAVGRPMKVGREEMVGVWLAAEKYATLDFEALERGLHDQAGYVIRELSKIPGLKAGLAPYENARRLPRVSVTWDEQAVGLTTGQCEQQLLEGEPRIAVLRERSQGLRLAFFMADPGDERVAVRRLKEIFSAARKTSVRA